MSSPPPAPAGRGSYRFTTLLVVLLVAAAGGYYLYERSLNPLPQPVDSFAALKDYFRQLAAGDKLAPEYADADGDLVADPPKEASKFRAVDVIGFTVVATSDEERRKAEEEEWKDFMTALGKATGKKVEYRADLGSPEEQMAALKEGKLHVTAFNTGAVSKAVTSAGFVPLFAPADAAGKYGYHALVLVKADSPVQSLGDLKGKNLAFVALSSNSGARAPMFALHQKHNLLPGRDYSYQISGDHYTAVVDVLEGKADAACVASDLKDRAFTAKFKVRGLDRNPTAQEVRVIHTSEPFPPLCFGVPHDLPPDVREKVVAAFRDFRFEGTSVAARNVPQGKVKFAPVNYKADWQPVRDTDAALAKLADVK